MEIIVCPLKELGAVMARHGPTHLISLLPQTEMIATPGSIGAGRHLKVAVNDISAPTDGLVAPAAEHAISVIEFAREWDRRAPLAIHCFAGISRSTAAALIALCAIDPDRDEHEIANAVRAAAPSAAPNRLLVSHGDTALGRNGRMISAVDAMGAAAFAAEGRVFALRTKPLPA